MISYGFGVSNARTDDSPSRECQTVANATYADNHYFNLYIKKNPFLSNFPPSDTRVFLKVLRTQFLLVTEKRFSFLASSLKFGTPRENGNIGNFKMKNTVTQ